MATYTSILSDNVFLTIDEVIEWIGIKARNIEVPQAEVAASVDIQNLSYTSKLVGTLGNAITIEYISGGTAGSESVSVVTNAIQVTIDNGVSTANQIKAAIEGFGPSFALVSISLVGASTGLEAQGTVAATNLAGGLDDEPYDDDDIPVARRNLERVMNMACSKIEKIIEASVIEIEHEEDLDGNASNIVIPSKFPITEVTELKIDYNRDFNTNSILDPINYLLRGAVDDRSSIADKRKLGTDVILVDDKTDNVIGRIFSGSVLGAIRIKYKSGWARDINDIPNDLKQAAILLCEYYYFQRSNKDLGVTSKGVMGESYSKTTDGIPNAVMELIEPFQDYNFGYQNNRQSNVFGV